MTLSPTDQTPTSSTPDQTPHSSPPTEPPAVPPVASGPPHEQPSVSSDVTTPSPIPHPDQPTVLSPTTPTNQSDSLVSNSSSTSLVTKPTTNTNCTSATCTNCSSLRHDLSIVRRRLARQQQRHAELLEMHRTHGQRLLRAHYEHRLSEVMDENIAKTTSILNQQKKCFEDELEAMENEARAREAALRAELDEERTLNLRLESDFNREREEALEKADETMQAVQRKLAQLHARATRLEMEKNTLETTLTEKGLALDNLSVSLEERSVEKRRMQLIVKNADDERLRKDKVIEALQQEVSGLRERLSAEEDINLELQGKIKIVESKRQEDRTKFEKELAEFKVNAKKESDRLGILFGSVIQDFANAQSDVSAVESEERSRRNYAQNDSVVDSD